MKTKVNVDFLGGKSIKPEDIYPFLKEKESEKLKIDWFRTFINSIPLLTFLTGLFIGANL